MPENTLESLIRMHKKGASWFEIDCQLMRDGNIAILHDEKIDRTTTGKGKITKMSLHDLHAVFVKGGDGGEKIPMLPDLMEYAFNHNLHIQIEMKGFNQHLVDKIDTLIGRFDCDLFSVYAFDVRTIGAFCQKHPRYPVHWNMRKLTLKKLEKAKLLGINVNLNGQYVKKSDIEKLKECEKKVHIFTVNDIDRANELFEFGVDAIITDRYSLLEEQLSG